MVYYQHCVQHCSNVQKESISAFHLSVFPIFFWKKKKQKTTHSNKSGEVAQKILLLLEKEG